MGQRDGKTLGYLDQNQTILVVYVPIQAPTGFINGATSFLKASPLRCPYDVTLVKLFWILS